MNTPRSTLASRSWSGAGSASAAPLLEAHRDLVLSAKVLHADETPGWLLDPGAGRTAKAHVWAYASGEYDGTAGVIYELQHRPGPRVLGGLPKASSGTLTCGAYRGYDAGFRRDGCIEAGCLAYAQEVR